MITLSSTFDKENLSYEKVSKGKFLMDHIVESPADTSNNSVGALTANLSKAATDLTSDWDSTSVYQVKNLVNYYSIENIEKSDMTDHLYFDLSVSNKEKSSLKIKLKISKKNSPVSKNLFLF
ncbi:unnamed protein product [Lactuca saligna]|uniref:Uncharacterized protein n=1 Tax=Lactuca saligna TaxID=75948 RepID=A0AA35ZPQ0_LACSI|nr:unnamed protein product [Lactuca saligna]